MSRTTETTQGWNIHGEELEVTCLTEGPLTCQFIVSRPRKSLIWVCLIAAALAVFAVHCYKEVSKTKLLVASLLVAATGFVYYSYFDVCEESIWVVKGLGVQIGRKFRSGRQTAELIEFSAVADVIINEAITMHKVIFYLALLIIAGGTEGRADSFRVVPLFTLLPKASVNDSDSSLTDSTPSLETIKPIYNGMRQVMFNSQTKLPDKMAS